MFLRSVFILLFSVFWLNACGVTSTEEDQDNPTVKGPANDVLKEAGSLHRFTLQTFIDNPDYNNDQMQLSFDNFSPSTSDEEPEHWSDPIDQNWLGYSLDIWQDTARTWDNNPAPLQASPYNKPRAYRIYQNGVLQAAPPSTYNRPIYKAIDDNIFEMQLGASFIWDFSAFNGTQAEQDISGDRLDNYATLYSYPLLEHVDQWSDISSWGNNAIPRFSQGAMVYAASRSVSRDSIVIEAVYDGNNFTLANTKFAQGMVDLSAALSTYPYGGTRLAYQFTLDYTQNYTLYLSFDVSSAKARLYTDNNPSSTPVAEVPLSIDSVNMTAEINTQVLSNTERSALNLPVYFNPIIIGPVGTGNDYYYGKHYIKTTDLNRSLLRPVFFFNSTAKNDIKTTFKAWRDKEYDDFIN